MSIIRFCGFRHQRCRHAMPELESEHVNLVSCLCAQLVSRFVFPLPRQSCWPRSKFSQTAWEMLQRDVSMERGQLGDSCTSTNALTSAHTSAKCFKLSTQQFDGAGVLGTALCAAPTCLWESLNFAPPKRRYRFQ